MKTKGGLGNFTREFIVYKTMVGHTHVLYGYILFYSDNEFRVFYTGLILSLAGSICVLRELLLSLMVSIPIHAHYW